MKRRPLNVFKGKITRIVRRPISADLAIELAPGLELISRLSASSFNAMNPRCGQTASVVIPAVDVVVVPS
jgi:molybdopterin-binding protein